MSTQDTSHRLINMLMATEPDEDEVQELYEDLRKIFDGPFDEEINAAMARNCIYIEQPESALLN